MLKNVSLFYFTLTEGRFRLADRPFFVLRPLFFSSGLSPGLLTAGFRPLLVRAPSALKCPYAILLRTTPSGSSFPGGLQLIGETFMQFVDFAPVKLVFGPGRLEALRTEPLPGTRALLLTSNGRSMERIGALARVTAILEERGVAVVHMGIVEPNPTVSTVMKVAARMKEEGCDFLVALGGGSVMDCAKISGLMATNPGELWDYVQGGTGGRRAFEHDPLPLVAITTTAGTGSEVDAGGVITNPETREKVGIGHPGCFPKLAIVDPELMVSVPPALTAYQGFDALFHAVEGYVGKRPNFMSDMYALEAVRHLAAWLPKAVADGTDIKAREHVAFANTMAGFVMTTTRLTSQHAMEHALSAFHPELPHGAGLIMLSMAYFGHMVAVGAQSERFVALARAMGVEDAVQPSDFLSALSRLIHDCGMQDLKMSDWGITREELPAMTEVCRSAGVHAFEQDANYFTFEDTLAVYKAAFR